MKQVTLIAAVAKNGVIGNNGVLPWHLPTDLAHFKNLTMGKTVVMGRKTWESLPPKFKPLPNRKNVILSSDENYETPGGHVISSIEKLLENIVDDLFVIGGSQIYSLMLPIATRLEITEVHKAFDGDARFPEIGSEWKLRVASTTHRENELVFNFNTYTK